MANDTVSSRYAQALLELGQQHDCADEFLEQSTALVGLFEQSADFREVLLNPGINIEERRKTVRAIGEALGLNQMVTNFVMLLLDNDRIRKLPGIAEAYREKLNDARGRVRANVTTAVSLSDDQLGRIRDVLAEVTGREVELETDVEPDIIGGAVARVDGVVYDGSVRSQLHELKDKILQEV
jgi:F-type H+-transporting ATPase subunit delta